VRHFLFFLLLISSPIALLGQVGGEHVYEFLTLPNNARTTASGGQQVALLDEHPLLGAQNPALYNDSMDHRLSAGIVNFFSDIVYGQAAYSWSRDSLTQLGVNVTYIDYGDFIEANQTGQITGEFGGGETAISFGGSRLLGKTRLGVNLKGIFSSIAGFQSTGFATDIGASWTRKEKRRTIGFVVKNLGYQLSPFVEGNQEDLPFDIQLGFTKRLAHVPFRFSFQANNLYRWKLRPDEVIDSTSGIFDTNAASDTEIFFDNLFRHFIFGGELYFGKAVSLRFGYNHRRRQELALQTKNGLTGFSFGGSINIRRFQFDYGFSSYHVAGGSHHFTVSTQL